MTTRVKCGQPVREEDFGGGSLVGPTNHTGHVPVASAALLEFIVNLDLFFLTADYK